ncbi:hypothetical protein [Thalassolituus maritimus]|uniref:Uncharacterized protein n=1 Tax=Thalassolituus maritimus TaxID=484498 RepID=A0ABQ0A1I6_9GAMM
MAQRKKQPYTGWIKKHMRDGSWLKHQVKTNAKLIKEEYLWNYINGILLPDDPFYESAKTTLQKIERNWRSKQSRQGKKVITISAESQRRIERYRKQSGKTAIEIIDELTSLLESSRNQEFPHLPLAINQKLQENDKLKDHRDGPDTYKPGDPLL